MRETFLFSDEDADLREHRWAVNRDGYAVGRSGCIGGSGTFAHRIVLSRILGRELTSSDVCDHANGNPADNRRCNLRLTDRSGNSQNRRASVSHGRRGVTWNKWRGKWQAAVKFQRRSFHVGLFEDLDEAAAASAAKRREFGFLDRPEEMCVPPSTT